MKSKAKNVPARSLRDVSLDAEIKYASKSAYSSGTDCTVSHAFFMSPCKMHKGRSIKLREYEFEYGSFVDLEMYSLLKRDYAVKL